MERKRIKQGRSAATLLRLRAAGNSISARAVTPAAVAGICLTAAVAGTLLSYAEKSAQSAHTPTDAKSTKAVKTGALQASKHATVTTAVQTKDTKATTVAAISGRRSVDFYTGDVRATMFSEPVAPAPPAPPPVVDPNSIAPPPPDPYENYNYTGSATIGDEKYAIVENIETHDGYLLKVGDKLPYLDSKVASIDGDFLRFSGNESKSMFISMNTSPIPLSASAGFLAPKTQGQPGQGGLAGLTPQQLATLAAAAGGNTPGMGGFGRGGRGGGRGGGGGGFGGGGGGRRNRGGGGGGFGGFGGG